MPAADPVVAHLDPAELAGARKIAVQALLDAAFPDPAGHQYSETPARIVLLSIGERPIGHIAAFLRTVRIGEETLRIGLIGDVAVDPECRGRGYAKRLLVEAHAFFRAAALPFSVLFAYKPAYYVSCGYRPLTRETRFRDTDGSVKQFVFRAAMAAELSARSWPDAVLDLQGGTV